MEIVEKTDDAWLDEIEFIRHERRKNYYAWQEKQADDEYAEMMANRRELNEYTKSI